MSDTGWVQHAGGVVAVTGLEPDGDDFRHVLAEPIELTGPVVLRSLDAAVNEVIRDGVEVRSTYVPAQEVAATTGLVRSLSVAPPPTPDGRLRIIEIVGIDRQAWGGTHLANTGESRPIRITKVESKGKRNRRIRFALV